MSTAAFCILAVSDANSASSFAVAERYASINSAIEMDGRSAAACWAIADRVAAPPQAPLRKRLE